MSSVEADKNTVLNDSADNSSPEVKEITAPEGSLPWTCEIQGEKIPKLTEKYHTDARDWDVNSITVGQNILLKCTGETQVLNPKKTELQILGKQDGHLSNYRLKLKKIDVWQENQIQIIVNSYVPAKHKLEFILTDGENSLQIKDFNLEVASAMALNPKGFAGESVLEENKEESQLTELAEDVGNLGLNQSAEPRNQKNPQTATMEKPKTYPLWGPHKVSDPWYFWAAIAAFVLFVLWLVYKVLNHFQNKQRIESIWQDSQAALGPYREFTKNIRKIEKKWRLKEVNSQEFVKELRSEFNWYFFREFKVYAPELKSRAIMKEWKKKYPIIYFKNSSSLKKLFLEFDRAEKLEDLNDTDVNQYLHTLRDRVDKFSVAKRDYELKNQGGKK